MGGQISYYKHEWEKITSDASILQTVEGEVIEFNVLPPDRHFAVNPKTDKIEERAIDLQIQEMLTKRIIVPSKHEIHEYVSPIFVTAKQDETFRLILNLKKLNEYVTYEHFKMESIKSVARCVTKNCYMAKIDLKDAYYSVGIHPHYQKYLKFSWKGPLYQYVCFPNGLAPCPRKFTKLFKPVLATLRQMAIIIAGYLDDFFTCANTYVACYHDLGKIKDLFTSLGFKIHPEKSSTHPTQILEFLGFLIDSTNMTISLTTKKKEKLAMLILSILNNQTSEIRTVAKALGSIVASFPASKYGPLYYRSIDRDKTSALKSSYGSYEAQMTISAEGRLEFEWWLQNLPTMHNSIHLPPFAFVMYTDACEYAWGAILDDQPTGGAWDLTEGDLHINIQEILAIYYALRSFCSLLKNSHTKIFCDNTTAVYAINKMGSSKSIECNSFVKQVWTFCHLHNIWITCAHIPGSENTDADTESRRLYQDGEWKLNPVIFQEIIHQFHYFPDIDLFASRLNTQLTSYASHKPDPFATYVDAFTLNWNEFNPYIFPPFSLMSRVLQKIQVDQAKALIVAPLWPTQVWYTTFLHMLVGKPTFIHPSPTNLYLPNKPKTLHPLHARLTLVIGIVSAENSSVKDIALSQQTY